MADISSEAARQTPFDIVYTPPEDLYKGFSGSTPTDSKIEGIIADKEHILDRLNKYRDDKISGEDFDKAIKYLTPAELTPGKSVNVGKEQSFFGISDSLSYQDVLEVSRRVENISPSSDADFSNKPPKVFVQPEFPPEDSKERAILNHLIAKDGDLDYNKLGGASYSASEDVVRINQAKLNELSKAQAESVLSHEFGHREDFNTRGSHTAVYNDEKALGQGLINKFANDCKTEMPADGKVPDTDSLLGIVTHPRNAECAATAQEVVNTRNKGERITERENTKLSHDRELAADCYSAASGYGSDFKQVLSANPEMSSATHPDTVSRFDNILKSSPENAKAFSDFGKCGISGATNIDSFAAPATSVLQASGIGK